MCAKPKEKRTSISIFISTKRKLEDKGYYGESMDDIINRILGEEEKKQTIADDSYDRLITDHLGE